MFEGKEEKRGKKKRKEEKEEKENGKGRGWKKGIKEAKKREIEAFFH